MSGARSAKSHSREHDLRVGFRDLAHQAKPFWAEMSPGPPVRPRRERWIPRWGSWIGWPVHPAPVLRFAFLLRLCSCNCALDALFGLVMPTAALWAVRCLYDFGADKIAILALQSLRSRHVQA